MNTYIAKKYPIYESKILQIIFITLFVSIICAQPNTAKAEKELFHEMYSENTEQLSYLGSLGITKKTSVEVGNISGTDLPSAEVTVEEFTNVGDVEFAEKVNVKMGDVGLNYDVKAGRFFKKAEDGTIVEVRGAQIEAGVTVTVVGAEVTESITWNTKYGDVGAEVEGKIAILAEAKASLEAKCDKLEGCEIGAAFDAFIGVKAAAKGDVFIEIAGVKIELMVELEVSAGIGAAGDYGLKIGPDGEIEIRGDIAVAIGLGVGGSVGIKVDASELLEYLGFDTKEQLIAFLEAIKKGYEFGKAVAIATGEFVVEVVEVGIEVAEITYEGIEYVDDLKDAARDAALDVAGDFAGEQTVELATTLTDQWLGMYNWLFDKPETVELDITPNPGDLLEIIQRPPVVPTSALFLQPKKQDVCEEDAGTLLKQPKKEVPTDVNRPKLNKAEEVTRPGEVIRPELHEIPSVVLPW